MDISFEYYRIFYYVAKYENITKAAMVLKSSQPNVTRIIHILEDQLDCRLFLREPRGLKLTEEGRRLYAHVAIACQHLLDAEDELCREKDICAGTIELGVTETALHLFCLGTCMIFSALTRILKSVFRTIQHLTFSSHWRTVVWISLW